MSKLVWDQSTERKYETGVEQVALYPQVAGAYPAGVAWNGFSALTLSPSGAEPTALYANNKKYLELISAEQLGGTIEAYTYPDEFMACDGSVAVATGVFLGQQSRQSFGLVAKTIIGNDTEKNKHGYKLHLIYGATASVAEKAYNTINESPEVDPFSWEFSTTPVDVEGHDATSYVCIDSTKADKTKLAALEAILYGSEEAEPRLPLPAEVAEMMATDAG